MSKIAAIIAGGLLAALTAGGLLASYEAWGMPGALDEPVSVRQGSVGGRPGGTRPVGYFSHRHRSHFGGGFHGGK